MQLFTSEAPNLAPSTSREPNQITGNEVARFLPIQETGLGELDFSAIVDDSNQAKDESVAAAAANFELDVDSLLGGDAVIIDDALNVVTDSSEQKQPGGKAVE